ncbi:hypothetical protein KUTeg_017426 [Tegillarca granosa]|uniref:C2H2-type domain-containing protein n=1 Tax=Tegillarca granosa TaxID=220873 RepID=A0ABQ9EEW3_TEGGR|nr:hypothetical protein KUTeg_017426 [Tegillarca granosa]
MTLDKLGYRHIFNLGMQVEIVQPNIVFDIASLMLYGAQATPIRLKILLDRLFSVLQHDEDSNGRVLDKWSITSREEEHIILQQFLRFGETKSIAQEIIMQDTRDQQELYIKQTSRAESEIKKFIERSNHTMQTYMRALEPRHLFGNRLPFVPIGSRLMSPPSLPSFSPPTPNRELRPPIVTASSSPASSSPLGRLQTMQPFDYRREQCSPAISPSVPDKHHSGSSPSPSPQNLSTTPSSVQSSTTPPFTPLKLEVGEHLPTSLGTPMTLPIIPPQDDDCADAIDYSTNKDQSENHRSVFADRKIKHLRKSTNPIKRQWTPSASFGTSFVGPNGKKRVLCTACNKTFCDKGALKIHYSAVHLKEMHKCTVDGCNMMFSSRRSRNRHSANPNPKLHMPQKRIKMPEGATCIDDGSIKPNMSGVNSPTAMLVPSALSPRHQIPQLDNPDIQHGNQNFYAELNAHMAMFPSPEKKIKLDSDDGPKDLRMPDRKDDRSEAEIEMMDGGSDESLKADSPQQRGTSRRKTMVPTRCAQPDEHLVMSDDNSDDRDPDICKDESPRRYVRSRGQNDPYGEPGDHQRSRSDRHGTPQRYYLSPDSAILPAENISDDEEEMSKFMNQPHKRNFPKIASLLSMNSQEAIDFSAKHKEESDDNKSVSSVTSHMSNDESNLSIISNESSKVTKMNGNTSPDSPSEDVSIDSENPNKCTICSKTFPNHFGAKAHFQNVHLKLQHSCTVKGCNAIFPSKRSRNRHSSNHMLHQKLLSTSDSEHEPHEDTETGESEGKNKKDESIQDNTTNEANGINHINGSCKIDNAEKSDLENENEENMEIEEEEKINKSENDVDRDENSLEDNELGVNCHVCQSKFKDNLALKEHFEINHPKEMFKCNIKGCQKIFSTRKSRNRHSQNGNLHKNLGNAKTNGIS